MFFDFIPPSRSGTVQEANVYQKVPAYANAYFRNAKRCYNDIDNVNVIVNVNEYDNVNVNEYEYVNDDVNENVNVNKNENVIVNDNGQLL